GRRFSSDSASLPFPQTVMSYPSTSSTLAQLSRSVCSSSTIRIRIVFLTSSVSASESDAFTDARSVRCRPFEASLRFGDALHLMGASARYPFLAPAAVRTAVFGRRYPALTGSGPRADWPRNTNTPRVWRGAYINQLVVRQSITVDRPACHGRPG